MRWGTLTVRGATPRLFPSFQHTFGVLRVPDGWKSSAEPLRGKDANGDFRTKSEEVYTPLHCERLARCILSVPIRSQQADVEGGDKVTASEAATTPAALHPSVHATSVTPTHAKSVTFASVPKPYTADTCDDATDDLDSPADENVNDTPTGGANDGSDVNDTGYRLGDRIQVYWTKEKKWFSGSIVDNTQVHLYKNGNRKLRAPQLQVSYDDGATLSHSLHNTEVRHATSVPSVFMLLSERIAGTECQQSADCLDEFITPDSEREMFYFLTDIEIDLVSGEALNTVSIFAIAEDGALLAASRVNSMDTLNARYWHEPKNEREFLRSPQRAIWQTAKELKWDQYLQLNMFDWVKLSSVDRKKHVIYNTLWAYKIKLNSDTTFKKLNPRWCLKGTSMDRDVFKSHAETLCACHRFVSSWHSKAVTGRHFATFYSTAAMLFKQHAPMVSSRAQCLMSTAGLRLVSKRLPRMVSAMFASLIVACRAELTQHACSTDVCSRCFW